MLIDSGFMSEFNKKFINIRRELQSFREGHHFIRIRFSSQS